MPTLLITGSNRGLGLETARQYANDGWQVFACCRNPETATELQELAHAFEQLSIHKLDMADTHEIETLQQSIGKQPIDLLWNNAGVYGGEAYTFGKTDEQAWQYATQVNVIAPMKMMEAFVENVATSDLKLIASTSSKMGSMDDNGSGAAYAYRATKASLNAIMVSAAHDLKHRGISCIILHPGWVRTDMGGPNGELSTTESVTMMKNILINASLEDSGKFFDIDGSIIPW